MPQAKAAEMISPNPVTVSTTAGHTIVFEAGQPVFVPAFAVGECMKAGARPTKYYSNTVTPVPAVGAKGQITSEVSFPKEALEAVEETILNTDTDTQNRKDRDEPKRNEKVFNEAEVRVRRGIEILLARANPSDWTGDLPKVAVLNAEVSSMSVTAAMRDSVWAKMSEAGLIPEDYRDTIGL